MSGTLGASDPINSRPFATASSNTHIDCSQGIFMMLKSICFTVPLHLFSPVLSQSVIDVGVGHSIQDIQVAIQGASPGDVIVVHPPVSPQWGFNLDRGVTLRVNGRLSLSAYDPNIPSNRASTTISIPAGQTANLEGLDFNNNYGPAGSPGHRVLVNGGSVVFRNCTFVSTNGSAVRAVSTAVQFDDCTLRGALTYGTAPGLDAVSSHVVIRDSDLFGHNSGTYPFGGTIPAAPAAILHGGTAHIERSTFTGGDATAGIVVSGACDMWISDSACSSIGGISIDANANSGGVVSLAETNLAEPSLGHLVTDPGQVRLRWAALPFVRGGLTSGVVRSAPAQPVAVCFAPDTSPIRLLIAHQPVWLVSGDCAVFGLTARDGIFAFPVQVPNVASLLNQAISFQAISGTQLPVHLSTPAGGVIR